MLTNNGITNCLIYIYMYIYIHIYTYGLPLRLRESGVCSVTASKQWCISPRPAVLNHWDYTSPVYLYIMPVLSL